jgi:acetolactate synthase-1/2/3 large subunit
MHDCDLMVAIGARFDDRITGRLDAFSPNSKKIHIDIDPSSINKNIVVDLGIVGDVAHVLEDLMLAWKSSYAKIDSKNLKNWWEQIDLWRGKESLKYVQTGQVIKPQHALSRLQELTNKLEQDVYITTEVGQHQMWAAQYLNFEQPNRWLTSGGLGTMGYGLPAAMGVQVAHPKAMVVGVSGEGSFMMNMQELATIVQYRLPVKILILNNFSLGMVRQWQELMHGSRYSESYMESLPDFVKMAEAFGMKGLRATKLSEMDEMLKKLLAHEGPVLADLHVDPKENVFPMIPAGAAHNEMILGPDDIGEKSGAQEGMALV